MRKSKSVLVVSCTHVGHRGGLCGPDNWQSIDTTDPKLLMIGTLQRQVYRWWTNYVVASKPDIVIHVGDVIDGPQEKSKGEDLWTTRQEEQADAAIKLLRPFKKSGNISRLGDSKTDGLRRAHALFHCFKQVFLLLYSEIKLQ